MILSLKSLICRRLNALRHNVKQRLRRWTKPDNQSLVLNAVLDPTRSKSELILENALLRQQLIVLQRHIKRPALTWRDRALLVFIASKLPSWKKTLIIVQPDTLLRWHRDLFWWVWRRKSARKAKKGREPLSEDIVTLINTKVPQTTLGFAVRCGGRSGHMNQSQATTGIPPHCLYYTSRGATAQISRTQH